MRGVRSLATWTHTEPEVCTLLHPCVKEWNQEEENEEQEENTNKQVVVASIWRKNHQDIMGSLVEFVDL